MDDEEQVEELEGTAETDALACSWQLYGKLADLKEKHGRIWAIAATEAEKLHAWIAYAMTTVDDGG